MTAPRSPTRHAQGPFVWLAMFGVLLCALPALSGQPPLAIDPDGVLPVPRPLARMLSLLAWLVPIGPHALRVELLSAACIALGAAIVCRELPALLRARPAIASALGLIAAFALAALCFRLSRDSLRALGPVALALVLGGAAMASHARAGARGRGWLVLGWLSLVLFFEHAHALLVLPALVAIYYAAFVLFRLASREGSEGSRDAAPGPLGRLPALTVLVAIALSFLLLRAEARALEARAAARDPVRDLLADGLVRELPARALVLADQLVFTGLHELAREQGSRPDRLLVSLDALTDPRETAALVARAPELTGLLRAQALHGELDVPELQTLATQRPVLLLAAPSVLGRAPLPEVLLPSKLFAQVSSSAAISADLKAAAQSNARFSRALEASYPSDRALLEPGTRKLLREHHLVRGLLLASLEHGRSLTEALAQADAFAPTPEEREALRAELLALGLSPELAP